MKKIISWILTLSLLLSCLALTAFAASGVGSDGVVWQMSDGGKLTISGPGPMENHTPAGGGWGSWVAKYIWLGDHSYSYDLKDIRSIEVLGNLSRIGSSAFASCRWNEDTIIYDGVQVIGRWAFLSNEAMKSVFIPTSVTTIESMAFYQCDSLTDVYYGGTEAQWNAISIDDDNEDLTGAEIHFLSKPGVKPVFNTQFKDVPGGVFYETGVIWALEKGVTTGVDDTHFAPDNVCTRAQVVTFLWRAMGEPEPQTKTNPFTDVKEGQFHYKAVLWAVEKGITNGMKANYFGSSDSCTRGQVATFLWRAMDKPAVSTGSNPFGDVSADRFYHEAVLWAVDNGVTKGVDDTHFAPEATCTHGQTVTFLYRALGK